MNVNIYILPPGSTIASPKPCGGCQDKSAASVVVVADAGPPIDGPPPCPANGTHTFKCVNGVAAWVAD